MGEPGQDPSERRRIGFIFGTRPEAIKLAPVIKACREVPELEPVVCVTAQHRLLLDQVLQFFGVEPEADLNLMREGQSLTGFAGRALGAIGTWLDGRELSAVVVQGDTTTTLMAALAAYHRRTPVAHVEAGLRTFEKYEPFPEEMNRRLTDHLADILFAPTALAAANLRAEGVSPASVHVTGNTVIDAVFHVRELLRLNGAEPPVRLSGDGPVLTVTVHRRENFGQPLLHICEALAALLEWHDSLQVVIPVHPNPNVGPVIRERLGGQPRVYLIDPPNYLQFIALLSASDVVMTDSGGVQEEAPVLGKPTLVLRRVTERQEAVEGGSARVVGSSPQAIVQEVERLLTDTEYYNRVARFHSPYGDGESSSRIAAILRDAMN